MSADTRPAHSLEAPTETVDPASLGLGHLNHLVDSPTPGAPVTFDPRFIGDGSGTEYMTLGEMESLLSRRADLVDWQDYGQVQRFQAAQAQVAALRQQREEKGQELLAEKAASLTSDVEAAERTAVQLQDSYSRLERALKDGRLTSAEFHQQAAELSTRERRIEEDLERLESRLEELDEDPVRYLDGLARRFPHAHGIPAPNW